MLKNAYASILFLIWLECSALYALVFIHFLPFPPPYFLLYFNARNTPLKIQSWGLSTHLPICRVPLLPVVPTVLYSSFCLEITLFLGNWATLSFLCQERVGEIVSKKICPHIFLAKRQKVTFRAFSSYKILNNGRNVLFYNTQ